MSLKILEANGPLEETQIKALERRLGKSFPESYRKFLTTYNGGHPQPHIFDYILKDGRNWTGGVRMFWGINPENKYRDMLYYAGIYDERLPSHIVPIANANGGDVLALSTTGNDVGSVYLWDHEEEAEDGEPPTYDNLYFVAKSFTDFLNCLRSFNSEELAEIEKHAAQAEVK